MTIRVGLIGGVAIDDDCGGALGLNAKAKATLIKHLETAAIVMNIEPNDINPNDLITKEILMGRASDIRNMARIASIGHNDLGQDLKLLTNVCLGLAALAAALGGITGLSSSLSTVTIGVITIISAAITGLTLVVLTTANFGEHLAAASRYEALVGQVTLFIFNLPIMGLVEANRQCIALKEEWIRAETEARSVRLRRPRINKSREVAKAKWPADFAQN